MKVVRLLNNKVVEIIPEYALPVAEWYGEEFASQCAEAPDEVDYDWVYDPNTGEFSEPPEVIPEPTTEERVTALEEQMAQSDEVAIALFEQQAVLEEQLAQADETAIYLFEMQATQDEINAAQDEALIALFEMIGGEE